MTPDPRAGAHAAPGHRLPELRRWAAERGIPEASRGPEPLGEGYFDPRTPRPYQEEALRRWREAGRRGSVVLPTGAGKSLVAVLAVREGGSGACVVVPTRALLHQWFTQLAEAFGGDQVGAWYGDEKDARAVTVTTYHSAFHLLEREGARFGVLVLDEVHHLADSRDGDPRSWHDALRIAPSAARLGLTATYPDGASSELERLVGPVVYRRTIGEMADQELADFVLERRFVSLEPGEEARYRLADEVYRSFLEARRYEERAPDAEGRWRLFMAETRRSPGARRALRAFQERERIVALAEGKLREAARILRLHPAEQAILFCGSRRAAETVSRRLAVPMVTAHTPASERREILKGMEDGRLRAVASVRVLDEGWDVPAAKLGIVLGDSTRGGGRQHAQRLGRILRRQGDRVASLYEVVAAGTYEFLASQKRRTGVRSVRERQLGLGF
jgi:superfamily II DNA or RNA helicase